MGFTNLFLKAGTAYESFEGSDKGTDMGRWFKKMLNRYGVRFNDACCDGASDVGAAQIQSVAGAVSTTSYLTKFTSTGAYAATLADGYEGQKKLLFFRIDGGDVTITPAHMSGGTTITLNDAGDYIELVFVAGAWKALTNSGATIA